MGKRSERLNRRKQMAFVAEEEKRKEAEARKGAASTPTANEVEKLGTDEMKLDAPVQEQDNCNAAVTSGTGVQGNGEHPESKASARKTVPENNALSEDKLDSSSAKPATATLPDNESSESDKSDEDDVKALLSKHLGSKVTAKRGNWHSAASLQSSEEEESSSLSDGIVQVTKVVKRKKNTVQFDTSIDSIDEYLSSSPDKRVGKDSDVDGLTEHLDRAHLVTEKETTNKGTRIRQEPASTNPQPENQPNYAYPPSLPRGGYDLQQPRAPVYYHPPPAVQMPVPRPAGYYVVPPRYHYPPAPYPPAPYPPFPQFAAPSPQLPTQQASRRIHDGHLTTLNDPTPLTGRDRQQLEAPGRVENNAAALSLTRAGESKVDREDGGDVNGSNPPSPCRGYRGRTDEIVEAGRQVMKATKKRVNEYSAALSQTKDKFAIKKENRVLKGFYEMAQMHQLESNNLDPDDSMNIGWSDEEDVDEPRVVSSIMIYDPFENNGKCGGRPKKSGPALKEKPSLFMGFGSETQKDRLLKKLKIAAANDWKSSDELTVELAYDFHEARKIRSGGEDRRRFGEGTVDAAIAAQTPSTKAAASTIGTTPGRALLDARNIFGDEDDG